MSTWPAIEVALERLEAEGPSGIPEQVFAALADRLQSAIESPDETRLKKASVILENLYRQMLSHSPPAVQKAARRARNGEAEAAFLLGKASFAQLLAARAADTRADSRFLAHVTDRRFRNYISALAQRPLTGSELMRYVGERKETVSRKLAILRTLGLVVSRKQGNTVVNSLTPAAAGACEKLRHERDILVTHEPAIPSSVVEIRKGLPDYMQNRPPFQLRAVG